MTLKSHAKFEGKLTSALKNDIGNLANFYATSRKSKNLHFDGILLSKANKILDEKVQKSYASCHWRVIQSLRKNWLLIPKMTWGIWWISMGALTGLKSFTLMCYFCKKNAMFELKKYRGVVSRKLTYGFKNDIRDLLNFHTNSWK